MAGRVRGAVSAVLHVALGLALAGALVMALGLAALPRTGWYAAYAVTSASMAPAIPLGAAVAVVPVAPGELRPGDVITFTSPRPPHATFTHRIVRIVDGPRGTSFETKGDANVAPDAWRVRYARSAGKVALSVPYAGFAVELATGNPARAAMAFAMAALLLIAGLRLLWRRQPEAARPPLARPVLLRAVGLAPVAGGVCRWFRGKTASGRLRVVCAAATLTSLWTVSLSGTTGYTLAAFTGNTTNSNNTFVTANAFSAAPVVNQVSPFDGATNEGTNTKASVTFSEGMDPTSSQSAFSLYPLNGASAPSCSGGTAGSTAAGTFAWSNNNTLLVFTPSSVLSGNTCYQVKVGTGARAAGSGPHLSSAVTATFSTQAGTVNQNPSVVPPTVPTTTTSTPYPTGTALNTNIQLSFSATMNQGTVWNSGTNSGAFSLKDSTHSCYVWPTSSTPLCSVSGGKDFSGTSSPFQWTGSSQNIMTFAPATNALQANTTYLVTVSTSAADVLGNTLNQGACSPTACAYSSGFVTGSSGTKINAPGAVTITDPPAGTPVWTTATSYTIAGTTSEGNDLVQVYSGSSCSGSALASSQEANGLTSFSTNTPLSVGANTLSVNAQNSAGTSACATVPTITRSDPATNVTGISTSATQSQINVVVTYTGDANSNSSAYLSYCQGNGCTPGTPATSMGTPANGQFNYTLGSLSNFTQYNVEVQVRDADGFDGSSSSNCTVASSTCTSGSLSVTTLGIASGAGAVNSVTLSPSLALASFAPQSQAFTVNFSCGGSCTSGSMDVNLGGFAGFFGTTTTCVNVTGTAGNLTATSIWNGQLNGAAAADGTDNYTVNVFSGGGCGFGSLVAQSSGTLTVSNAKAVTMSPSPNSVTLSSNQSVTVFATITNALHGTNTVAGGDAGAPSDGTAAKVSFSAVGSVSNSDLSFTSGTGSGSNPALTAYVGVLSSGCSGSLSAGQSCAQLNVSSAISQTITVKASVTGASGTVSGSTTVLDPPEPPSGLSLTPGSIRMAWQPSPTLNVAGYKIFMGHASGQYDRIIDVGKTTSAHITDVDYGTTYYVSIRAYTAEGLVSSPSGESSITLPAATATPSCATPSPSPTPPAGSPTPTATGSATPTPTRTNTPTPIPCATATATATATSTATPATTPSPMPTASESPTPTPTATSSASPTSTVSATPISTASPVPSASPTSTSTAAASSSPTSTVTAAATMRPTATTTRMPTATPTATTLPAPTPTRTPTP